MNKVNFSTTLILSILFFTTTIEAMETNKNIFSPPNNINLSNNTNQNNITKIKNNANNNILENSNSKTTINYEIPKNSIKINNDKKNEKEIENLNTINIKQNEEINPKSQKTFKENKEYYEKFEIALAQESIEKIFKNLKTMIYKFKHLRIIYYTPGISLYSPKKSRMENFYGQKNTNTIFTNLIYSQINYIITNYCSASNYKTTLSEPRLAAIKEKYLNNILNNYDLTQEEEKKINDEYINECKEYIVELHNKILDNIKTSKDEEITKYTNYAKYCSNVNRCITKFYISYDELCEEEKKYTKIIKKCNKDENLKEQIVEIFKECIKNNEDNKESRTIHDLYNNIIKIQDYLKSLNNDEENNKEKEKIDNLKEEIKNIIKENKKLFEQKSNTITIEDLIKYNKKIINLGKNLGEIMEIITNNLTQENYKTNVNMSDLIIDIMQKIFENRKIPIPKETFNNLYKYLQKP